MRRKLTLTIDEEVYDGLRSVVGPGKISQFIEELVRPYVVNDDLYAAYKEMSENQPREKEALKWSEEIIGEVM